ncbi:MAG: NusG domain II-containing protein [Clostridia bacterium]|nr:NusG domain II-containing protein [Clostridia bacterium]
MEQKRPANRNVLVIAMIVLVIAAVLVISALQSPKLTPTGGALGTLEPVMTAQPAAAEEPTAEPAEAEAAGTAKTPAKAYLVVTVAGVMYEPIALHEPGRYTVTRGENVNIIEVTEDSVWMDESTCDNQDCILQGVVSLDNMDTRVFQNLIICLPNEVMLQLFTPEQLADALMSMLEEGGGTNE